MKKTKVMGLGWAGRALSGKHMPLEQEILVQVHLKGGEMRIGTEPVQKAVFTPALLSEWVKTEHIRPWHMYFDIGRETYRLTLKRVNND